MNDTIFTLPQRFPELRIIVSDRSDGNMSLKWGPREETLQRRSTFLDAAGIPAQRCVSYSLVHRDRIIEVGPSDEGRGFLPRRSAQECDGAYTRARGLYHFFLVADCLPIILYAPRVSLLGFLHGSWKSTEMDITGQCIRQWQKRYRVDPSEIWTEIGPGIRPCCFRFNNPTQKLLSGWEPYIHEEDGLSSVDLIGYTKAQLLDCGIAPAHILDTGVCTSCQNETFFSHYHDIRAGIPEGRFAVVAGMRAETA